MTNWSDTPEGMISRLDESLLRRGEDAALRRSFGTQRVPVDVTVRVHLRGYDPSELGGVDGITQQDQKFIMSPTQINAAQWPGAHPPRSGLPIDERIPRVMDDTLITTRGPLAVQAAAGKYVRDVLVRIEGRVRGQ